MIIFLVRKSRSFLQNFYRKIRHFFDGFFLVIALLLLHPLLHPHLFFMYSLVDCILNLLAIELIAINTLHLSLALSLCSSAVLLLCSYAPLPRKSGLSTPFPLLPPLSDHFFRRFPEQLYRALIYDFFTQIQPKWQQKITTATVTTIIILIGVKEETEKSGKSHLSADDELQRRKNHYILRSILSRK